MARRATLLINRAAILSPQRRSEQCKQTHVSHDISFRAFEDLAGTLREWFLLLRGQHIRDPRHRRILPPTNRGRGRPISIQVRSHFRTYLGFPSRFRWRSSEYGRVSISSEPKVSGRSPRFWNDLR